MTNLNQTQFQELTQGSEPILVEFWAPWCVYCRRITPAMEQISQQGTIRIGLINIDEEPLLANIEQIEVIPTLVLYRDGQALGSIVAPESKARIEEFIEQTLS